MISLYRFWIQLCDGVVQVVVRHRFLLLRKHFHFGTKNTSFETSKAVKRLLVFIVLPDPCPCVGNAERNGVPGHSSTCIRSVSKSIRIIHNTQSFMLRLLMIYRDY